MQKLNSQHNEAISQIQRAILKIAPDDVSIRLAAAMLACQRRDMRYDEFDTVTTVADRFHRAVEQIVDHAVSHQLVQRLVWAVRASIYSQTPEYSGTVVRMLQTATGMMLLLLTSSIDLTNTISDKVSEEYEDGEHVQRSFETVDEKINNLSAEIYNILRRMAHSFGRYYEESSGKPERCELYFGDYEGDIHADAAKYLRMSEAELGELLLRLRAGEHEDAIDSPQAVLEKEIAEDVKLAVAVAEDNLSDDEIATIRAYLVQKLADGAGISLDDEGFVPE